MGHRETQAGSMVSVILPVYNRAALVGRAIKSVLDQSHIALELIVVDDGSTDDLVAALGAFDDARLKLISLPANKGAAVARNAAIRKGQGQYLAFIDSDDWWLPQKLEHQLDFMTRTGARLSCTTSIVLNKYHPGGMLRGDGKDTIGLRELTSGCVWSPGSTLLADARMFDHVGLFDERLRRLEDWDWMLRAAQNAAFAILDEPLSYVDGREGSTATYEAVKTSTRQMRQTHASDMPLLSKPGLKFRAALERELASAAYKQGRHVLALGHFAKSLLHSPLLRWDTVQRLTGAVSKDVSQLMKPR